MTTGPNALDPALMDPESYALASALHEQFAMVGQGVRAYARTHNLDPATVSRSLNCAAVPTWDFIKELVWSAATARGAPPNTETLARLFELYEKLVAANTDKRGHVVQLLRGEVARCQLEITRHEESLKGLGQELENANRLNIELNSQVKALESGRVQALNTGGADLVLRDGRKLRSERTAVESTIAELRIRVEQERRLKQAAEQRCRDYEELLSTIFAEEELELSKTKTWVNSPLLMEDEDNDAELRGVRNQVAINPAQRYSAALVESLRNQIANKDDQIAKKDTQILELENRLSQAESQLLQTRSHAAQPSPLPRHEGFLIDQWQAEGKFANG